MVHLRIVNGTPALLLRYRSHSPHKNITINYQIMETVESKAGRSKQPPPTCRVAIVGAQRQRVARTIALLLRAGDESSRESISTISLLASSSSTSTRRSSTADDDAAVPTTTTNTTTSEDDGIVVLPPKGVPVAVDVEYLPCVATFDAYDDERTGASVRYLARLEYHGPNGLLVRGRSLAPFFDDIDHPAGDDDDGAKKHPFPGIAAVAIGCGIEGEDDVDKIRCFFEALSSCCTDAHIISGGRSVVTMIRCLQPNSGYASMKEENEAFRQFNEDEKEEAASNGTFGPGKMVTFVREVAKRAIRQRWDDEFTEYERKSFVLPETEAHQQKTHPTTNEGTSSSADDDVTMPPGGEVVLCTSTATQHTPNPELTRYACKICRTPLFGIGDLEDPPHGQLLHTFRKNKKMYKVGYGGGGSAGPCQNHCIARPLAWMDDGCAGVEGKLHCPKCKTKVGHYSWTGAQCSCGTWVTPAIMVPLSKVDEMRPPTSSQDATTVVTTGSSLGVDHCNTAVGLMSLGMEGHCQNTVRQ